MSDPPGFPDEDDNDGADEVGEQVDTWRRRKRREKREDESDDEMGVAERGGAV